MRSIIYFLYAVMVLAFFVTTAVVVCAAPSMAGEIRGSVKDVLENPLSGATLILKTSDNTTVINTQSDSDGNFTFVNIAPGSYAVWAGKSGFQKSSVVVTVVSGTNAAVMLTLASENALETSIIAERLIRARNSLSPTTGGSVFHFDQEDIKTLPEGANTTFNQVLLQAPGVVNDSFKQFHVRGDEGNVQYRLNGIMMPEGITTGFGPIFDTRFFNRLDLLTGALPAQFGFHTAAVVDIETKTYKQPEGLVEVYGGSHDTLKPSFELGGSKGNLTYYLNGSFLTDDLGIENPTANHSAIHDHTDQETGFGYFSYLLNSTTKLSLLLGTYDGSFQIPNQPGQIPIANYLSQLNITGFDSASVNNRQTEANRFEMVALQSSLGPNFDYQVAFVSRQNSAHFEPDTIGDMAFYGVASDIYRSSLTNALQGDGSYRMNDAHTARIGVYISDENIISNNTSLVFPVDANGNVTGTPYTIVDNNPKNGNILWGAYLQDEWRLTDSLTVNYGARYDRMQAFVTADQVSPRLAVVYKATPDTILHVAYARYFTPPQTELVSPSTIAVFANTPNEPEVTLNSPVLPERSHYFDIGAVQKVTPELNIGLDGFYKIVKDMLDEAQFGPALLFSDLNYAKGYIYGIELTGNYKSGNFGSYANFAYNICKAADLVSGQWSWSQAEVDYISNHWVYLDHDQIYTASIGISYDLSGTTCSVDATYGSGLRRGFAGTDKMPDNKQVNVGARRKFQAGIVGPMEMRLAVINVFDTVNAIRDEGGGVFAPQYGPRLATYAGISKIF
jgi:outer membrane receptor protein involved in Fe transport